MAAVIVLLPISGVLDTDNDRDDCTEVWRRSSVVPGDGRYEKLEHQSGFLHERGLISPEMEECTRQLWLCERLAAGKLDPGLADRIQLDLSEAAVRQLKATGLYEEWLDAWDVHNGIEFAPPEEHSAPPPPTEAMLAAAEAPAQHLLAVAEEFQRNLQRLREWRAPEIAEAGDEPH